MNEYRASQRPNAKPKFPFFFESRLNQLKRFMVKVKLSTLVLFFFAKLCGNCARVASLTAVKQREITNAKQMRLDKTYFESRKTSKRYLWFIWLGLVKKTRRGYSYRHSIKISNRNSRKLASSFFEIFGFQSVFLRFRFSG